MMKALCTALLLIGSTAAIQAGTQFPTTFTLAGHYDAINDPIGNPIAPSLAGSVSLRFISYSKG
jgi:hypothetical protein